MWDITADCWRVGAVNGASVSDDNYIYTSISTVGYENISLVYNVDPWAQNNQNDGCYLFYSTDNKTNWMQIGRLWYGDDHIRQQTEYLDASANDNEALTIKIVDTASDSGSTCYVSDFMLTAMSVSTTTTTTTTTTASTDFVLTGVTTHTTGTWTSTTAHTIGDMETSSYIFDQHFEAIVVSILIAMLCVCCGILFAILRRKRHNLNNAQQNVMQMNVQQQAPAADAELRNQSVQMAGIATVATPASTERKDNDEDDEGNVNENEGQLPMVTGQSERTMAERLVDEEKNDGGEIGEVQRESMVEPGSPRRLIQTIAGPTAGGFDEEVDTIVNLEQDEFIVMDD